MTDSHSVDSPERDQLLVAQSALSAGDRISHGAELRGAIFRAAIGVLIAAMLAVVVYVYPAHVAWLTVVSTLLFGVAIGLAIVLYRRGRIASSRGSTRGYVIASAGSLGLYVVGVLLSASEAVTGSGFWIPYILLTAFPLCLSGVVRAIATAR